jgi:putative spermidine/putrescine transport system substrate-binding protein
LDQTPLKVIGTSVTLHDSLRKQAERDLGFPISFEIHDGKDCQQRGVMHPESYDIYDQWFHSVDLLWTAGSIEPIDTARIERWHQISPLVRDGTLGGRDGKARGSCPADVLYVLENNTLGSLPGRNISMLPTTYNVDAFAYSSDLVQDLAPHEAESWAWLFDDRWHNRCVISDDPGSSIVELAIAAVASGLIEVADIGNLTIEEADALFDLLNQRKKAGHFARSWASHEESVRLMSMPANMLGSLWSPAFYQLRALGRDLVYAAPKEGSRGWHSGLSLSAALSDDMRDNAYAFLNWWLSGVPGAIMARQGYYMSVVEPLRDTLSQAEWDYWYDGQPALMDLPSIDGDIAVRRGEVRKGGSYRERVSSIAVWSTIMDEQNYIIRRWREFLDS